MPAVLTIVMLGIFAIAFPYLTLKMMPPTEPVEGTENGGLPLLMIQNFSLLAAMIGIIATTTLGMPSVRRARTRASRYLYILSLGMMYMLCFSFVVFSFVPPIELLDILVLLTVILFPVGWGLAEFLDMRATKESL